MSIYLSNNREAKIIARTSTRQSPRGWATSSGQYAAPEKEDHLTSGEALACDGGG